MYYVAGFGFTNAALSNPKLVFEYAFNFWTLAMGVSPNTTIATILGIGWILWNVAILAFGIIHFSRMALAQAFDRFLPAPLAYVSPKYGSPVYAHLIDLVVTAALVGLTAFYYGPLSALGTAIVAAIIYFVVIAIGAAVYGLKHEKGGARAVLVIAGILDAIAFAYVTSQFFVFPNVYGGNILSYGYVVGTFILGAVIYLASKAYHAKRGIDLGLVYKEIPPE
jgi:amino acid transporter